MTQLDELVEYGGTIPSLIEASDEYTYANEVEKYLTWWDVNNTPQLENFRSQLNTLSSEIQQVANDTVTVYNNTVTVRNEVETMKDIVLDASNYEGDWTSDKTYQAGASVSYSDGNIYYSKIDDNTSEPTAGESSAEWYFTGRKDFVYVIASSDYNASIRDFIKCDTSSNDFTITLPAVPDEDDIIGILDFKGTFDANPLSVARNGNLIMGLEEDMEIDTKNISLELIYINGDWRVK